VTLPIPRPRRARVASRAAVLPHTRLRPLSRPLRPATQTQRNATSGSSPRRAVSLRRQSLHTSPSRRTGPASKQRHDRGTSTFDRIALRPTARNRRLFNSARRGRGASSRRRYLSPRPESLSPTAASPPTTQIRVSITTGQTRVSKDHEIARRYPGAWTTPIGTRRRHRHPAPAEPGHPPARALEPRLVRDGHGARARLRRRWVSNWGSPPEAPSSRWPGRAIAGRSSRSAMTSRRATTGSDPVVASSAYRVSAIVLARFWLPFGFQAPVWSPTVDGSSSPTNTPVTVLPFCV